jgi:hypothetical protein
MIKKLLSILKRFWLVVVLVVAAVVYFVFSAPPRVGVVSSLPQDKSEAVSQTTDIFVNFDKEVPASVQKLIRISISPEESIEFIWTGNKVKIVPKEKLDPGTTYLLVVKLRETELFRFSFTTALFTEEQLAREGALQSQDDFEYGEAFKAFAQQYPWYLALPIERNEYRIVYDFEESSFRIRLKLVPTDAETEKKIVDRALEEIRKLGIKDPIPYSVVR